MISLSLILQILQAAKIMRRFFYEAPAEIMRIYTTAARKNIDEVDPGSKNTVWFNSGDFEIFHIYF